MRANPTITIVGAGLVGSLLAIGLAKRDFNIRMLERRPDMRKHDVGAGRSINLAISTRGITALEKIGLDQEVLQHAVPMKGRMMHDTSGALTFQPYGTNDSEFINSISRATLNKILMTHAEKSGNVHIQFGKRVTGIDFDTDEVFFEDDGFNMMGSQKTEIVIGTDGSASAIRTAMSRRQGYQVSSSALDYGYKELVIQPADGGGFRMERNALHIWPRGSYMLIALPNFEGSFTCTLFLPFSGPNSFEHLTNAEAVEEFFNKNFPDAVELVSDLKNTFLQNPMGHMDTIKCNRWNVGEKVLLMGDAAHGIVPFFGQGMNCGFEDCTIFEQLLDKYQKGRSIDWEALFTELSNTRIPNTNAIADMAVENFVEMRDKVADKGFLMEKAVEKILQQQFPGRYLSRYAMVTFSNAPYTAAQKVGLVNESILRELCRGLTQPEDVDMQKAELLINEKLAPVLAPYASLLAGVPAH